MKNKLLTVVVPVYKVEQYINKCLDSAMDESISINAILHVLGRV